jgi:hypothetical protein
LKPGEEAPQRSAEEASVTKVYTSEQFWDKVAREEERDLQVVLNRCKFERDRCALSLALRLMLIRTNNSSEGYHVRSRDESELEGSINGRIKEECRLRGEKDGQVVECQGQSIDVPGLKADAD